MANRNISWGYQALRQFNKAILYIAEDSLQNAEKVRAEVVGEIEILTVHPEKHPLDKYKIDNDGNYRVFELHRLRVAYFIGNDIIRILRVRHTSREPQNY
jgi:plasmid stabilization system protein ParE